MLTPLEPGNSRAHDGSGKRVGAIEIALPTGARICVDASVNGHLFIICGKRGDDFKGQYRDGSGLWLIAKRLDKGRFVWPPIVDGAMTLTLAQFAALAEAMDWRRTIAPPPASQPVLL